MSRLPWADVRARDLRDFGACPVCGTWATWDQVTRAYQDRRGRTFRRITGCGPRTVLTHCGVRWRAGLRITRSPYAEWQEVEWL
jgi:hypothetical protein